jgi:hypothetical protein
MPAASPGLPAGAIAHLSLHCGKKPFYCSNGYKNKKKMIARAYSSGVVILSAIVSQALTCVQAAQLYINSTQVNRETGKGRCDNSIYRCAGFLID